MILSRLRYLIASGITDAQHLAVRGGSNGGLLVGAVMTAARSDGGGITRGRGAGYAALPYVYCRRWLGFDYGTAEQSKAMFDYLLGYSPVHNVRVGPVSSDPSYYRRS